MCRQPNVGSSLTLDPTYAEENVMPTEILMPALSPTMEEGKLAKWLVKEGQSVKAGDIIAEIETDKATMEVEAVDEGKVGRLLISEGTEGVKVNTPIATLLADGESAGAVPAAKASTTPPATKSATRSTPPGGEGLGVEGTPTANVLRSPPPQPSPTRGEGPARPAPAANGRGDARIFASPLARRLAKEAGLDLAALSGSGPHGRVVKRDVETAVQNGGVRAQARAGTAVTAKPTAGTLTPQPMADDKVLALYEQGSYEVIPHDNMRRVIAQRLTLSKQTIPHFRLSVDCRLDELLRARERMNSVSPKDGPRSYKLSVNDFAIKALALALQQVPAGNVTWTEAGTLRHKYSDIGVAVAIEGGLFTPIIRHAELKSMSEISNEMRDLAERARKRRLAPHEYQGGTTSISNLGMYGIKSFDAVINPPHATILAVGMGEKRPVVSGDKVEVATLVTCTLSCDHRVVDGAVGAELLGAFKMLVEDPVRMLV
jgi:pyruvate dehydrogenase E2 component (dihydrolipoamide acetyltransferase)